MSFSRFSVGKIANDGKFPVTLVFGKETEAGVFRFDPSFGDARRSRTKRVQSLAEALKVHGKKIVELLRQAAEDGSELILVIGDPRLYGAPWEAARCLLRYGGEIGSPQK